LTGTLATIVHLDVVFRRATRNCQSPAFRIASQKQEINKFEILPVTAEEGGLHPSTSSRGSNELTKRPQLISFLERLMHADISLPRCEREEQEHVVRTKVIQNVQKTSSF
jgi:hypothetical protein